MFSENELTRQWKVRGKRKTFQVDQTGFELQYINLQKTKICPLWLEGQGVCYFFCLFVCFWHREIGVGRVEEDFVFLNLRTQSLSPIWLFTTPWTVARQAPMPIGFSWQEYQSEQPFPSPGDISDPGILLIGEAGENINEAILDEK